MSSPVEKCFNIKEIIQYVSFLSSFFSIFCIWHLSILLNLVVISSFSLLNTISLHAYLSIHINISISSPFSIKWQYTGLLDIYSQRQQARISSSSSPFCSWIDAWLLRLTKWWLSWVSHTVFWYSFLYLLS